MTFLFMIQVQVSSLSPRKNVGLVTQVLSTIQTQALLIQIQMEDTPKLHYFMEVLHLKDKWVQIQFA